MKKTLAVILGVFALAVESLGAEDSDCKCISPYNSKANLIGYKCSTSTDNTKSPNGYSSRLSLVQGSVAGNSSDNTIPIDYNYNSKTSLVISNW